MSKSLPIACPLMREACTGGVVDVHGFAHYCAFYLDDTCYVLDALKGIGNVMNYEKQIEVSVSGAVDTYEQN